tara:strand:- start:3476 stop:4675 length:1200 start_codon:yes stop_codon:yes gene_type:complete
MAKNTHLEHIEDDILNQGMEGGFNAIKFLTELGDMLDQPGSAIRVTTKWDGAPAIICGKDPSNGKFFVGTKSVFAKTAPKVIYSEADADKIYPNQGQLTQKLKDSYKYLSQLPITGVLQGDLLFTDDKRSVDIGGERCITFQPNTIVYAIPSKSDLGIKASKAQLGIVFHTTYSGPTLADMNASFGADISTLQNHDNVMVFSSDFKDATSVANMNDFEKQQYKSLLNRTEGSLKKSSAFLNVLAQTGQSKFQMNKLFKQFFNTYIRKGTALPDTNKLIDDFKKYYNDLLLKESQSKKTQSSKDKYNHIRYDGLNFIDKNKQSVYFTIASYKNIIEAKTFIIRKLEKVKQIGTFLRTDNGYQVTAPEGFVAIKSTNALKLVDRLEFSRANFTAAKNWDQG